MRQMKKTFDLTHNSKVIIYGCGDIGRNTAQELITQGYNIAAFVDRNAKQIRKWKGIPVIDLVQMADIDKIDEYIVLVMLHNGMSHEPVALECHRHGAVNIVYLPMHVSRSYEDRFIMRRIYKYLHSYQFELVKNVPVYAMPDNNIEDSKIIDIYASGDIAFWCPIEKIIVIAEDLCGIKNFNPYVDFFRWLKGENINIDSYLRCTGRYSEKLRVNWLEERKELYGIYLDALKYDLTFFTDAPSPCIWNPEGFFTFEEGLTRASFLISEGYEEIPICVSEADYYAWKEYKKGVVVNA